MLSETVCVASSAIFPSKACRVAMATLYYTGLAVLNVEARDLQLACKLCSLRSYTCTVQQRRRKDFLIGGGTVFSKISTGHIEWACHRLKTWGGGGGGGGGTCPQFPVRLRWLRALMCHLYM